MVNKPAYYNEVDEYAAEWLRNLINAGHIAPGDVDTRSIEDVHPNDLKPYTQCHFFAGIGVWSAALRRAGWPDDRRVWTGSCPCQPFSAAGAGAGFDDERHLWPAWHWLIAQCRPAVLLGEQVASRDSEPWIDLVSTDLEGLGYAVGALAFPSAGVGAPHIRDRLYWVANAASSGLQRGQFGGQRLVAQRAAAQRGVEVGGLVDADQPGRESGRRDDSAARYGVAFESTRESCGLADTSNSAGQRGEPRTAIGGLSAQPSQDAAVRPGPTNGLWRNADWLACRDGKWRPVEPGAFPLAHGAPARVGRLRAYGNAINLEAAVTFIDAAVNAIYDCQP